jgi:hypothetical protein
VPTASPQPSAEATLARSPSTEPAAPAQPVKFALEVSGERDGAAQTEFRSDAPNIFVHWAGQDLPMHSVVRVAWVAEDVGDLAPANFVVDQTETEITRPDFTARFTLSRPADGWAAGKYRVDLFLDDKLAQSVRVTITD